jgi:membrane protein required for colicin V production
MARLSVTESKMILVNWAGRSVEQITAVDWLIIGVVLLSTLIGTMRGFVKEALSLVTLIAAIVIARLFGAQVADMLVDYISVPSLRFAAAYGALFVAAMIVGSMVNFLLHQVVQLAGLSAINRILGMAFGCLRGGLIVLVAVAVLGRMPVSEDNWWRASVLIPHAVTTGAWLQVLVMDKLSEFTAAGKSV